MCTDSFSTCDTVLLTIKACNLLSSGLFRQGDGLTNVVEFDHNVAAFEVNGCLWITV